MLPDVFGQTDYSRATTEALAKTFACPVFMLDYFYQLTSKPSVFAEADRDEVFPIMERMTGEDFVAIWDKATGEIAKSYPELKHFAVIGFCFGGRLAYLAGMDAKVDRVVSFYGGGASKEFYAGKSSIEALVEARRDDQNLRVISFYGTQDESIPPADRAQTATALEAAGIESQTREYAAGHAYFQEGRSHYDQTAADQSWTELKNFLR